jgi:hypothetical protein
MQLNVHIPRPEGRVTVIYRQNTEGSKISENPTVITKNKAKKFIFNDLQYPKHPIAP